MSKKLFVGNLPFSTTQEELSELFAPWGPVESAAIITDRYTGQSRGFGFVELPDEQAGAAVAKMNGNPMGGRPLIVNEARPREAGAGGRPGGAYRGGEGRPEGGYREGGYREGGSREGGYREGGYREGGYRERSSGESNPYGPGPTTGPAPDTGGVSSGSRGRDYDRSSRDSGRGRDGGGREGGRDGGRSRDGGRGRDRDRRDRDWD